MNSGRAPLRSRPDLGLALLELPPVRHALCDPHFSLIPRPIDNGWYHAGFMGMMAGFNPTQHTHYYPARSALARWLADPADIGDDPVAHEQLVKDTLFLAHDYLHSWAYRTIAAIEPSLIGYGPVTPDNVDEQAFFLVLSETVAVVGLDYWYLCVRDIDERCNVALGVGPRTVHYRERLLHEYRRYNSALTVQEPQFFQKILTLYCRGSIDGFREQDLLDSPALASWLIRELLISPRQREVSRAWLSHLGGFALSSEQLEAKLPTPSARLQAHVDELAERLWDKIKRDREQFHPTAAGGRAWQLVVGADVDFRFANTGHVEDADARARRADDASFAFYVDQRLSRHELPDAETLARLREPIETIKQTRDHAGLARLLSSLTPVAEPAADPAPLELLFVN